MKELMAEVLVAQEAKIQALKAQLVDAEETIAALQTDALLCAIDAAQKAVSRAHFACANVSAGPYCTDAKKIAIGALGNLGAALSAITNVKGYRNVRN